MYQIYSSDIIAGSKIYMVDFINIATVCGACRNSTFPNGKDENDPGVSGFCNVAKAGSLVPINGEWDRLDRDSPRRPVKTQSACSVGEDIGGKFRLKFVAKSENK